MRLINEGEASMDISLEARDRFIPTDLLRSAYLPYDQSLNPTAPPFVTLPDDLELGIVSGEVPAVARAVSSLLRRSLEEARDDRGGHLPAEVVRRVQRGVISPEGVAHLWGATGHRFVMSRAVTSQEREVLATILVGRSKDTIFFFTGRYNNLRHSTITQDVDLTQPAGDDPSRRWFDLFAFPPLERFKPKGYHHIANFVVALEHRRCGLGRRLLDEVVRWYARDAIARDRREVAHAQHLLCGKGFWQIGDPPWLPRMRRLGFSLRWGAESFFMERDWAPLPTVWEGAQPLPNVLYNQRAGLPALYQGQPPPTGEEHLLERVPAVVALSQDPRAKLQYFQTMFDFVPAPTTPRG